MKRAAVLVALVLASAAGAASTADPGISSKRILIGGTVPLSGEAAAFGSVGPGAKAYFDYVNAQGGVNGRRIEYRYYDDGYDPVQTVQLTFISPKRVGQYTTCTQLRRVSSTEATARGAVFQAQGDQVTATLLPGTFVSICSLKPGVYVYTANYSFEGATTNDATLGMKGTIVVE